MTSKQIADRVREVIPDAEHGSRLAEEDRNACTAAADEIKRLRERLQGIVALTRYCTGTQPDQQRLAKVCQFAQGALSDHGSVVETKSPPAPDLQTRCNHGRIVHATWICPECSAEHERDSNAEEIPQRCICGRGKYYHPWRFCDNYRPVPKTPAPSAQETFGNSPEAPCTKG